MIEDAAGGDYGLPVSVSFHDGQTTQSINFTATNDDVDDDSGQVIVRFDTSLPDNVTAGNETTVRITDDDQRGVSVTPAMLTVDEGLSDSYDVVLTSRTHRRRQRGDHGRQPTPTSRSVPRRSRSPRPTGARRRPSRSRPRPTTWTPRTTRGPSPTPSAAATTIRSSVSAPSPSPSMTMKSVSASNARHTRSRKAATPSRSRSVSAPPPSRGSRSTWSRPTRATPPRTTTPLCPAASRSPGDTEQSFGFSALADTEDDDGESVLLGFDPLPRA